MAGAGILAPGSFRRAFPWKRCFPVAPGPFADGSGTTNTPGHSGGTAPDSHRLPFHRPLARSLPCPPAAVLAVAAVILAGTVAGVFAARRRPDATAIADRMLWISLWFDRPAGHVLQLRAVRAVGRRRRRSRVRLPRPGHRPRGRMALGAAVAAGRPHARRLHVRGVPREHGLPRAPVHRRASGHATRCRRRSPTTSSSRRRGCSWWRSRSARRTRRTRKAACGCSCCATPRCTRWWLGLLAPDTLAPSWAVDASNVLVVALAPLGFFALGVYANVSGAGLFPADHDARSSRPCW